MSNNRIKKNFIFADNLKANPHEDKKKFTNLIISKSGNTIETIVNANILIKRKDKKALHDWREFQQIKNELVGKEVEGIEMYPAESRLHDTANQFHIFCLPTGTSVKFGWDFRAVDYEHQDGGHNKRGQRGLNKPLI